MSGHITFDAQQANFYQELNMKAHKLARLQQTGQMVYKPSRNPLNAERSPRGEFKGFDFNPPPATHPEKERWNYPESDWGLMAKFKSQKAIYDTIYERDRKAKEIEEQIQRIKRENLEKIDLEKEKRRQWYEARQAEKEDAEKHMRLYEEEVNKAAMGVKAGGGSRNGMQGSRGENSLPVDLLELEESSQPTPVKKKHLSVDHFVDPNHEKINRSSVYAIEQSTKQNLKEMEKKLLSKKSIHDFKTSQLKPLYVTHPEILVQAREERAMLYLEKMGDKNSRTVENTLMGSKPFLPGGVATRPPAPTLFDAKKKAGGSGGGKGTGGLEGGLPTEVLKEELRKTEEQISMQKLKIGLQAGRGMKSYERERAGKSR
eukprot:gene24570-29686_t